MKRVVHFWRGSRRRMLLLLFCAIIAVIGGISAYSVRHWQGAERRTNSMTADVQAAIQELQSDTLESDRMVRALEVVVRAREVQCEPSGLGWQAGLIPAYRQQRDRCMKWREEGVLMAQQAERLRPYVHFERQAAAIVRQLSAELRAASAHDYGAAVQAWEQAQHSLASLAADNQLAREVKQQLVAAVRQAQESATALRAAHDAKDRAAFDERVVVLRQAHQRVADLRQAASTAFVQSVRQAFQ